MTCPHKHVEARIWSRHWKEWCVVAPTYRGQADALICRDCGEWLGLGESKDEGEAVKVEMRAAEIATMSRLNHDSGPDGCALCGWHYKESSGATINFQAGHLARCIVEHSEPQ